MICLVKINSLLSRSNIHDFFAEFRPTVGDFEVKFSLMKQICGQVISKSIPRIILKFLSELNEVLI